MGFLLVHELNHALSGLGDEYSYGFSEGDTGRFALPNCNANRDNLPWQGWIERRQADVAPNAGCTFDNFFRPTDNGCLMRSKVSQMCSVCRERTTQAIVTKKFNRDAGISLTGPTCPPDGFDIQLQADQSATLTINHHFITFNLNVTVVWVIPRIDGEPARIRSVPSQFVRGSDLPLGTNTITATVSDEIDYVLRADMTAPLVENRATFRIQRLASGARSGDCAQITCDSSTGSELSYCGNCTKDGGCEPSYAATPTDILAPSRVTFDQATQFIQILTVLLVIVGVVVVLFVLFIVITRRSSTPGELLVVPVMEQGLGIVAAVVATIAFLCTCGIIALLFVFLPRVPVFGLDVFIAFFIFASIVYVLIGITFCSVVARWVIAMCVTGVLTDIVAFAIFGAAAFAFYVSVNSDTTPMIDRYRSAWLEKVREDSATICSLQNFLECSGFESPCIPVPSSFCPANCDWQNRNPLPCLPKWQDFVVDTLRPIAIAALVYVFVLLVAGALAVMFGVSVDRLREVARGRRSYRKDPRAPVVAITDDELRVVELEFHKADKDNTGALEGRELHKFMHALFGEEFNAADEQALLEAATNEDGTQRPLSLDEVLDVFFPQRTMRPDPRLLTDDEAMDASNTADLIRRQFAKMERFMEASGALSPERLLSLHEGYIKAEIEEDEGGFIEVVRRAGESHAKTVEAEMCRGLTFNDLEGLRCAWVKLHEPIRGPLADAEIERLFYLTHDQGNFVSQEHFLRWKSMLDVRHKNSVGWPEFCYPFAQRNLLRNARQAITNSGRTLDLMSGMPRTMTRSDVALEHGNAFVHEIFMPFEETVPVERVVATVELGMRTGAVHVGDQGFDNDSDDDGTKLRPKQR
jgi:hypothetical protein